MISMPNTAGQISPSFSSLSLFSCLELASERTLRLTSLSSTSFYFAEYPKPSLQPVSKFFHSAPWFPVSQLCGISVLMSVQRIIEEYTGSAGLPQVCQCRILMLTSSHERAQWLRTPVLIDQYRLRTSLLIAFAVLGHLSNLRDRALRRPPARGRRRRTTTTTSWHLASDALEQLPPAALPARPDRRKRLTPAQGDLPFLRCRGRRLGAVQIPVEAVPARLNALVTRLETGTDLCCDRHRNSFLRPCRD